MVLLLYCVWRRFSEFCGVMSRLFENGDDSLPTNDLFQMVQQTQKQKKNGAAAAAAALPFLQSEADRFLRRLEDEDKIMMSEGQYYSLL